MLGDDKFGVVWECGEREVLTSAELKALAAYNPNLKTPVAGGATILLASGPPPKKTPVECMQRDATR